MRRHRHALFFLWLAFAFGVLHAAASAYWALGGTWLLASVGGAAVSAVDANPGGARLLLWVVGSVKLAAAAAPLLYAYGALPGWRLWRPAFWAGGLGLVLYGGANVVAGLLVLTGVLAPEGGFDRAGITGHTYIWGPLFLLWGAALAVALAGARHQRRHERGLQREAGATRTR